MFYTNDAILFICSICSHFSDVFDEDHFINVLANDVRVVKKLPKELATASKSKKEFRSWSGVEYYEEEITNSWLNHQVCLFDCFWSVHLLVFFF